MHLNQIQEKAKLSLKKEDGRNSRVLINILFKGLMISHWCLMKKNRKAKITFHNIFGVFCLKIKIRIRY
jgi:hypothetical protein